MDAIDMQRAQGARPAEQDRRAAHRAVRQGQRARHRRAGPGRPDDRARRQDHGLRRRHAASQAGGDDPELRRDAPRALHARRLGPGVPRAADRSTTGRRSTGRPTHAASRVDLDTLTPEEVASVEAGRARCCSTARCSPAATPRTSASPTCWPRARSCRSTSRTASSTTSARSIRSRDEVVGPAGPTTATRMDKFTDMMLDADRPARA